MTAYPAWTPASRPGIIPLRPLTFGTVLGRSFAALRQNPKVLLGFALVVQTVVYILLIAGIGAIGFTTFARLDTLRPGTEEFETVLAGSVLITALASFVLGLAATAVGVIVQAVVVSEVAHAVVAEKLTLRSLWRRIRPVAWRLIGYSLLLTLALVILLALVAALVFALALAAPGLAIALTVLLVLGSIPLFLWLTTKLALVPSAIILEQTTIPRAIGRSWTLIRGRFWPALGVLVVIGVMMGVLAQVVSIPFSLLTGVVSAIIAPTGAASPSEVVGIVIGLALTQVVVLLVQAVTLVVQSTAVALIYIDCRMRQEGLDLDLLGYIEQRDAGATSLPDPYALHAGRTLPRPVWGAPPYGAPAPGAAHGLPLSAAPSSGAGAAPPLPPDVTESPTAALPVPPGPPPPTVWTAPGAPAADADRR